MIYGDTAYLEGPIIKKITNVSLTMSSSLLLADCAAKRNPNNDDEL